jgi:predicted HicB family RNase H-like nuclease
MAKKQTRRSVSLNRELFELAKATAAEQEVSLSEFTESALRHQIAAASEVRQ